MDIAAVAQMCHEANRVICITNGDNSQKHWEDAEPWQRLSAIAGIEEVLKHPDITPEQLHQAWCRYKQDDGWVFGETKDAELKTHPCLVSYNELPEYQKLKDRVFRAIVQATT